MQWRIYIETFPGKFDQIIGLGLAPPSVGNPGSEPVVYHIVHQYKQLSFSILN